jgi:hypothetical protein
MMLDGYKTYIIGIVLIVKGAAGAAFPESGVSNDPAMDIQMGLVALGLRRAIK